MYSARSGLMVSGATIMLEENGKRKKRKNRFKETTGTGTHRQLSGLRILLGTFIDQFPYQTCPLLAQRHGSTAVAQYIVSELTIGRQCQVVGEVDPLGQLYQQIDAVTSAAILIR